MITYKIQLKTIEDFRKYVNMSVRFHIMGYVQIQEHKINMYDILDIIENGAVDKAELILTQYRVEELENLRQYLKNSGLPYLPSCPSAHLIYILDKLWNQVSIYIRIHYINRTFTTLAINLTQLYNTRQND